MGHAISALVPNHSAKHGPRQATSWHDPIINMPTARAIRLARQDQPIWRPLIHTSNRGAPLARLLCGTLHTNPYDALVNVYAVQINTSC